MRLLTFALVAVLLLTPTAASAQDWCDIHPDSPECGDLTEPVIPIIGPPCSSDFEWSCKEFNLFLPAIGVQNAWCAAFGAFDVDLFCCGLCNGFEGRLFSTAKRDCVRWFVVRYCFDILVGWEVLVMLMVGQKVRHNITEKSLLDEMSDYVDLEKFGGELEIYEITDNTKGFNILVGYDYDSALWLKENEINV